MTKQLKKIKLLTYNIFLRPPPIKTNQDDFKNQRIDDIINSIQNFDIICFQEMFQTATFRKQKLIQKAIQKGFLYWKDCQTPSFWHGPPVDSGLLVISKFPILQSKFQSYHVGILSDSASDKGYIYCKIEVQDKILHLFTTHLQASYLHPGMLYQRQLSIKTRLYQFRTLLKKIKQILNVNCKQSTKQLVLLMGDLNMNALMVPVTLHCSVLVNYFENLVKIKSWKSFPLILIVHENFFSKQILKLLIMHFKNIKKHPITFGDGDEILTDRLQSLSQQSLDFIFSLKVPNNTKLNKQNQINCFCKVFTIKYFKIRRRKFLKQIHWIKTNNIIYQSLIVQNKRQTLQTIIRSLWNVYLSSHLMRSNSQFFQFIIYMISKILSFYTLISFIIQIIFYH